MEDDKIRYSDIIEPDDSLEKLINQMGEVNQSYENLTNTIKSNANKFASTLRSVSGATEEGRKKIDEYSIAAARLEQAEIELKIAMSETGKEIARLKALTSDQNKMTVEQMRYVSQASTSYERYKSELKEAVRLYKSLTAAEREESAMGKQLLQEILNLKNNIRALDDEMKPHVQTLSEVQRAEERLAFLQSEEGVKLRDLKAQIRELTGARKQQKASVGPLVQAQERLTYARSEENEQLKLYSALIREANQIAKLQATINSSAEGSYNRLSAQYALNKIKLNQMSQAEREAADSGKKLEAETNAIYQQMIKLQEATGNYRLSVGHYARAFDGLSISIAQVVRELPAAVISPATFFLGISNNIPMVVDEINKLRARNKALQAEGRATVNIQKQIVKSLFSWNTALVLVLTTLSVFGNEIVQWISQLFKGKNATLSLGEALRNIATQLETSAQSYGDNIVTLKKLQEEWKNLNTEAEKLEMIKKRQDEFRSLGVAVKDVSEAENVLIWNTAAVIKSLQLRAQATAAYELAAETYKKALIKQLEAETLEDSPLTAIDRLVASRARSAASTKDIREQNIKELKDEEKALRNAADAYFKYGADYEESIKKIFEASGIRPYEKEEKAEKTRGKRERDLTDTIYRMRLSVQKKYEQSITELERDEYAKRRKAAIDAANAKIRELEETYRKNEDYLNDEENKYKELTDEEKKLVKDAQENIRTTIVNTQNQLTYELDQIEKDRQIAELKRTQETIQLRLQAVKKGTEEELALKLQAVKAERDIELLENSKKPLQEQQKPEDITAKYRKEGLSITVDYATTSFDQQQELDEAVFNEVKRSEKEITRFKLQQEKDRWLHQIELAESGALEWTQVQIDTAKAAVNKIDRELSELDDFWKNVGDEGLGHTLLEKLGFDDDIDKKIDALTEARDIIIDNIKAIAEAEVEAAEKAVEAAEARTQAAQEAYDAEIEARNNGYANNVADAKRTLQLEQANQKKKQKLLEDAQKRQATLDSISQASSLVTASANIWSAFSKGGAVGIALALAAIAAMWGSFAAAKIKAKQVTSNTQKYGDGGLEFLEGGSHASGNDIDLGVKNKRKRRMKAEGGEALAIINKKQTRRYRRVLPDIISSLNKGVFEDRYMGTFKIGEGLTTLETPAINLSAIENDLSRIRKQHEMQYHTLANGDTVIITGNVKRIIHR